MSVLIMILAAAAIIAFVKFGLLGGLDRIAPALAWSPKARGQALGYATSSPELVTLVAAGLSGVWEAGLWNIASSNIINAVLMLIAVLFFRRGRDLFRRQFLDEIGFALLGIAAPLLLMRFHLDTHWGVVPILLALFLGYLVFDRRLNRKPEAPVAKAEGNLPVGVIMCVVALLLIAVAGFFLGDATKDVVQQMSIHPAIAGWILGAVTSFPEVVTFFSVFARSRRKEGEDTVDDTQEVLDNLAASNMSNTGLIYPIGLTVYLLFALV